MAKILQAVKKMTKFTKFFGVFGVLGLYRLFRGVGIDGLCLRANGALVAEICAVKGGRTEKAEKQ